MNQPTNAVVVGVGLDGVDAAVDFAAGEARLAQAPLHLVHVLQIPAVDAYAGVYGGVIKDASSALEAALKRAQNQLDVRVPVTAERVDDGALINRLVTCGDRGRMIVLQHRRLGRAHRMATGSIVNGVAARAGVSVVSVPEGWSRTSKQLPVTVGVQDMHEAEALLGTAFEEAAIRGARLTILHAWWLNSGFDIVGVDQAYRELREAEVREQLQATLKPLQQRFPDVEAVLRVRHAPPGEALLDASVTSDVLVLGRRHHLLPLGSHLGPVARSVIDHSDCPVLLVPEQRTEVTRPAPSYVSGVMY